MNPDESLRVGGFSLIHLVSAFLLIGLFAFFVYLLWNGSCKRDDEEGEVLIPSARRVDSTPMYAQELEPGVVLLQSHDGEFFRILHEYDAAKQRDYNCEVSPISGASLQGQTIHYIPYCTRPHMQTQTSAPLAQQPDNGLMAWNQHGATAPPPAWNGATAPPPYQ